MAATTLKEEILKTLNKYIPNLDLSRYDVKDVFGIHSGPVVLKLNSIEIRGIILRSNPLLQRIGISTAPDYTQRQFPKGKHASI